MINDFRKRDNQRVSRRRRKGVSAVEFAVVAPVFFLFVFGMVEFGRVVMIQHCMTNASRAGCRMAILATTTTDDQVRAAVQNRLATSMADTSNVAVSVSPQNSLTGMSSGTQVEVQVGVSYGDVSWLPIGYLNPTIAARSIQQRE